MFLCTSPDPHYTAPAARWVMRRVTGTGVDVDIVDDLRVPCYSSRIDGRIWIRAGLPFAEYHWAMAKGLVHQLFGLETATEMPRERDTRMVALDARVVPFQRPPYSSGEWLH